MAIIVGNLTRDPEMKYTPKGSAVTTFAVATNRSWTTSEGVSEERAEFHNIVAWGKLAEICHQFLRKGRQVYIKGRIQTRNWNDESGNRRYWTEIVTEDMVMLGSRSGSGVSEERPSPQAEPKSPPRPPAGGGEQSTGKTKSQEDVEAEELPF